MFRGRDVRDVDEAVIAGLGRGWAAVVDRGGARPGMAHELLHGGQVGASVEQFASERTTAAVRAEVADAGRGPAAPR
jgi:hypothetical protein